MKIKIAVLHYLGSTGKLPELRIMSSSKQEKCWRRYGARMVEIDLVDLMAYEIKNESN